MNPYLKNLFFIFFLLSIQNISGQNISERFHNISIDDGLTQNSILCLYEDSKGFIWASTFDGINRYDGENITQYNPSSSSNKTVNSASVTSITEDFEGNLYFGTAGGGLNKFDPRTEIFTFYLYDKNNPKSIQDNFINDLYTDKQGMIWIATSHGVSAFNPKKESFVNYSRDLNKGINLPKTSIQEIFEDKNGILWFGSFGGGLGSLNTGTGEFRDFVNGQGETININENHIKHISQFNDSLIVLGTQQGIHFFNIDKLKFEDFNFYGLNEELKDIDINEVHKTLNGDVWICTNDNGIYLLNEKKKRSGYKYKKQKRVIFNGHAVITLLEDSKGILWIGTRNAGIYRHTKSTKKFEHIAYGSDGYGLPDKNVYSIAEDKNQQIWIGTINGIGVFDPETYKVIHIKPELHKKNTICDNRIWDLNFDRNENLWICTSNGLNKYDLNTKKYIHYKTDNTSNTIPTNELYVSLEDSYGVIWVGTYNGLSAIKPGLSKITNYYFDNLDTCSISYNKIWTIHEDSRKHLWIGSAFGLNRYDRKNDCFVSYFHKENDSTSIISNNVISITEDADGYLWISTDSGLSKFDPNENKVIKNITKKNGLPDNYVYSVQEHGEFIWYGTNKGLVKMHKQNYTLQTYDILDGIQSNEFNFPSFKSSNGKLYFGGINGVTMFYPDSIHKDTSKIELVFTKLTINGKRISSGDSLRGQLVIEKSILYSEEVFLDHKDQYIDLEFAGLDFHAPERILYKYRMNETEEWIEIGNQNNLSFTNLSPGTHFLEVKSTNADKIWMDQTLKLKIYVKPPFYRTILFYLIVIVSVLLIIYAYIRYRERRLKADKDLLEKLIKERTQELEEHKEEITRQNEALAEHKSLLEDKVMKRTADLEAAKIQAEESDRLKSAFLSNLSHEIRTPMNSILGFSGLLSMADIHEENRDDYIRLIAENGNSLMKLIDDILDFSMIESGQLELKYDEFIVQDLVLEVYSDFLKNQELKNKNLKLEFSTNQDKIVLKNDKLRVKQIIENLISNAVKYTETGSVSCNWKVKGNTIEFCISDTGIGIANEDIDSIFKRFVKIENREKLYRGAGIGLAITKNLVNLLEGEIWVESEIGKGSCFYVSLPGVIKYKPEIKKTQKSTVAIKLPEKLEVLIVEDESANYKFLKLVLERNGFKVHWAKNGKEAVEMVLQSPGIDLVLMDMKMPIMDGHKATIEIKKKKPELKIIAQTAYVMPDEVEEIFRIGCDDYIYKPINRDDLLNLISKHFSLPL